jgi:hypothetical protein
MQVKDKEISIISGLSTSALSHRKQTDKNLYEIIRLGAICKKFNISEEELIKYIELKGLICNQTKE